MPTSNEAILQTLETMNPFYSKFTGEEVEKGISEAIAVMTYLDRNVVVPAASLTGDYLQKSITTLDRDMWLESITLYCKNAFSPSASDITYEIATDAGARLVLIPSEFMLEQDGVLTYYINRIIRVETTINMVCSSTKAFGEILVKLNFR